MSASAVRMVGHRPYCRQHPRVRGAASGPRTTSPAWNQQLLDKLAVTSVQSKTPSARPVYSTNSMRDVIEASGTTHRNQRLDGLGDGGFGSVGVRETVRKEVPGLGGVVGGTGKYFADLQSTAMVLQCTAARGITADAHAASRQLKGITVDAGLLESLPPCMPVDSIRSRFAYKCGRQGTVAGLPFHHNDVERDRRLLSEEHGCSRDLTSLPSCCPWQSTTWTLSPRSAL